MNAACLNGTCVDFPPETWLSFTALEARGTDASNPQFPADCSAGHDCTLWRVFPDGSIQKYTGAGVPSPATLSAPDFGTIDRILRSQSFRQIFASGGPPICPSPPAGVSVLFELQNGFWQKGFDFTGCAVAGPTNDAMTLYDVVRKY